MDELQEKTLVEKAAELLLNRQPKVLSEYTLGRAGVQLLGSGAVYYLFQGEKVRPFHSRGEAEDGRTVDSRTAKAVSTQTRQIRDELGDGLLVQTVFRENGLELCRDIVLRETGALTVRLLIQDEKGKCVSTRFLAPLDAPYPDGDGKKLLLSLDQKMLLVPYDNDMWGRYESSVPQPGRASYDVTAIFDEDTFEGLVVGALDHDVWKNAVRWASHDARSFVAYSGAADGATHDCLPHGTVSGQQVASARFVLFWTKNVKDGMTRFGKLCTMVKPPRPWPGKAIFGWNSYSALGMGLRLSHWEEAGDFIHGELPAFSDEDGVSYINLDAAFGLNRKEIRRIVQKLHARGQKAGWYAAPCICMPIMKMMPIPGTLTPLGKLVLKDGHGNELPPADGSLPLDVTHPLWEKYARSTIRDLLDLGMDYIKLDFLSHAGVEGAHYRKEYTGRMALNYAYDILADELRKGGREIFVSLSIAPLFPYSLGNARRCCCDSFGHIEDVRYVLNALNFGWWTNGTLYRYNDPDHLTLYHSVIDGRGVTSEAEAESRYLSGLISGTLMILSDNYGPEGNPEQVNAARVRTKVLANRSRLNEIARWGQAFVPVELRSDTTPFYTLSHEGRYFAAVFNFKPDRRILSFDPIRGGLPPKGRAEDLLHGTCLTYAGKVAFQLDGHAAALLEIFAD